MVNLINYTKKGLADLPSNPILKFSDYASKIPDVIKFTLGEPDFDTPEHIKQAAIKSVTDNHSHYAPSNGTIGLRKAAANFWLKNMVKSMIQKLKFWLLLVFLNQFLTQF